MCNCFKYGEYTLEQTDRGEVDLSLNDKQIEIYDCYDKEYRILLKINYCPVCGEKL